MAETSEFSVQTFISKFKSGARANRFRVELVPPGHFRNSAAIQTFRFVCKATSLPPSTIGSVEVNYMGRVIKYPGDRAFDDWSTTVLNDADWSLRDMFEDWVDFMMEGKRNIATWVNNDQYTGEATVTQLGRDGKDIAAYKVIGIFPTTVQEISVDSSSNDAIEEYEVTFANSGWERLTSALS